MYILRIIPFVCIGSLHGMNGQKVASEITYSELIQVLKMPDISPRRTILKRPAQVQERLQNLVREMLSCGLIKFKEEADFVSKMIEGKRPKSNPRLLIKDFGAYCALLCSHNKIASEYVDLSRNGCIDDRIYLFIPRLFCLAVQRKNSGLAEALIKAVFPRLLTGCDEPRANVREYLAVLVPIFFYADDKEGLMRIGKMLGEAYILSGEMATLRAVFQGDRDFLREQEHCSDFLPFLKALLLGCCMKKESSSGMIAELLEKLEKVMGTKCVLKETFLSLLLREAEAANNLEIVACLTY